MGLQRTKSLPAIQVTDDGANMGQQPTATQKVLIPQPKMSVLIGCGNFSLSFSNLEGHREYNKYDI